MMQKTIYVPNDEIWESIRREAGKKDRSISKYLIWLHDKRLFESGSDKPAQKENFNPEKHIILDTPEEIKKKLKIKEAHRNGTYDPYFKPQLKGKQG